MGNIFEDAMEEGLQKGKLITLCDLVHDNLLSIQDAAARAAMTEQDFAIEMHKEGY